MDAQLQKQRQILFDSYWSTEATSSSAKISATPAVSIATLQLILLLIFFSSLLFSSFVYFIFLLPSMSWIGLSFLLSSVSRPLFNPFPCGFIFLDLNVYSSLCIRPFIEKNIKSTKFCGYLSGLNLSSTHLFCFMICFMALFK